MLRCATRRFFTSEAARQGKGIHAPQVLSQPLAALLQVDELSRPQTVKKLWEYIKANDLQDDEDRRTIVNDPPMRAVFGCDRMGMFEMQKLLSPHLEKKEAL